MNFLEKDLEEIIYNADREKLSERGLYISATEILKRQLKIGNYGIADLVSFKRPYFHKYLKETCKGSISVYELKKDRISISTFLQAVNYLHGIKRYLEKKGISENYDYNIVLIGKEFDDNSSFVYLPEILNTFSYIDNIDRPCIFNLNLYTYSYDIDGLKFNEISGYKLVNEGF